jgi:hypothetical protein
MACCFLPRRRAGPLAKGPYSRRHLTNATECNRQSDSSWVSLSSIDMYTYTANGRWRCICPHYVAPMACATASRSLGDSCCSPATAAASHLGGLQLRW